jgi:hypothetical protein
MYCASKITEYRHTSQPGAGDYMPNAAIVLLLQANNGQKREMGQNRQKKSHVTTRRFAHPTADPFDLFHY